MKNIEIRECHATLMIELAAMSVAARYLMEAATGLGATKLHEAKAELKDTSQRLFTLAEKIKP